MNVNLKDMLQVRLRCNMNRTLVGDVCNNGDRKYSKGKSKRKH